MNSACHRFITRGLSMWSTNYDKLWNYDNYTSQFLSQTEEGGRGGRGEENGSQPNSIQYSYSPGASRRECQEDCRRMSPSEIIARYRPRSEESFISDFWATEARKSDTPPLSWNFGRLIITSRAEDSHARRRRRGDKSREKRRNSSQFHKVMRDANKIGRK